jgi:choline kinase
MHTKYSRFVTPTKKPKISFSVNELSVIILSASPGKRMAIYGPRSLLPLKNKTTLIDYQLDIIQNLYPNSAVTIVAGFESDKVIQHLKNKRISIVINQGYEDQGPVGSLRLGLLANNNKHALIIHGDIFFNADTIRGIVGDTSRLLIDSDNRLSKDEIGLSIIKGLVSNLSYSWPTKWGQIAFIHNNDMGILKDFVYDSSHNKFYTHEAINHLIDNDCQLYPHTGNNIQLVEIDSFQEYKKLI